MLTLAPRAAGISRSFASVGSDRCSIASAPCRSAFYAHRERRRHEKAARIGNAMANGSLHHRSTGLGERTKADLMREAREIGIAGRPKMGKVALVEAIRERR